MPNYPKKIEFMGDGAMMSRESNQTLTLVSRNLTGIQYSIHKINENELKHLITQTSGDIASPSFSNWRFNENNLGPAIRGVKKLRRFSPQATQYTQINLKDEVAQSANELGLFYVTAQGYDHQRKQFESSAVSRLILVTDIGLLVKKQSNDIHRVFVQSLSDGKPLVKAEVSIVSISGQTLFRRYTDADGHVKFPSTKGLRKDKTPTVFVVRYRGDTAFIPYNRYQRQLNLSRFDIGGQRNTDKDALKAMIMTDRGIYRPGETVQFASIIKSQAMNTVESIPLKATIRDPQYKIVKEQRFMSNSVSGLNEFKF
ncbi:MAG: MG2 domain-containing protein, partial [Glaciecola sp.]